MTTIPDVVNGSEIKKIKSRKCPGCDPINVYIINKEEYRYYSVIRHIGLYLYIGSFDFYCNLVSMMCDRKFYQSVINDEKCFELWKLMWIEEELETVTRRILRSHERKEDLTHYNVINVIDGLKLQCNILGRLWSHISST